MTESGTVSDPSKGMQAATKITSASLRPPISGLIGILKPTGYTSMSILDTLKPLLAQSKLFQIPADQKLKNQQWKSSTKRRRDTDRFTEGGHFMAPKLGQGGTLDPLADGVLVLGIGAGTKRLQQFLECTKEYKTIGLLGTSTLSYDADDPILQRKPFDHVSAETIRNVLPSFRGKFKQMPPLFSAIRIDGVRLFDYARQGKDLPRPIEKRDVEVSHLQLIDWKAGGEHSYKEPDRECDDIERKVALRARQLAGMEPATNAAEKTVPPKSEDSKADAVEEDQIVKGDIRQTSAQEKDPLQASMVSPPAFTLEMTVSSGTYIRSIVHDVGSQVDSAAHVVRLSRTRQGDWISPEYQIKEGEDGTKFKKAIDWDVLRRAAEKLQDEAKVKRQKTEEGGVMVNGEKASDKDALDENDHDKLSEWEQLIVDHMQIIEV